MTNYLGIAMIVSAPSGAGKSTLIQKLRSDYPNILFSISCTTRPMRQGEVHGKDYYFISEQEFLDMRERGELAEWAKVHDHYYGSPLQAVQDQLLKGKDVIFDIDVQGAKQLKDTLLNANYLFIFPPSLQELEHRLVSRASDSLEVIQKRLNAAKDEMLSADFFDAWLVNDNLEEAYDKFKAFYLTAKLKNVNYSSLVQSILEH